MRPIINSLAILYDFLFDEFVLAILVFTLIMRLVLLPLMLRQTRQMKKLQSIQPRVRSLQTKYSDKSPESRRKLSSETMKIYKEAGVNPIGCLGPFVLQLPIWIGLYRAILSVFPTTPEGLVDLSRLFYFWNPSSAIAPFNPYFLGMDLAAFTQVAPLPLNFALPALVGITTWLQQKISTPAAADPRQQQTNQLLLWMMPIMLAVFSWNFPAGLTVYIFFSNVIGVVLQYFAGGRQPIAVMGRVFLGTAQTRAALEETINERAAAARAEANNNISASSKGEQITEDNNDDQTVHGKNRRRSNRNRSSSVRRRVRRH